jgi:hypothetical protein
MHTSGMSFSLNTEGNLDTRYKIGKLGGHYIK